MQYWAPVRFLAATVAVKKKTCADYLKLAVSDETKVTTICGKFPFDTDISPDMAGIKPFAQAQKVPDGKEILMNATNLTAAEYTALFDASTNNTNNTLGKEIADLDQSIATAYASFKACSAPEQCTPDELTMIQWMSGAITQSKYQPKDIAGNSFLGKDGNSISDAWANATVDPNALQRPEFVCHAPKDFTLTIASVKAIFDSKSLISLDDHLSAAVFTEYVMNTPPEESQKLLSTVYPALEF